MRYRSHLLAPLALAILSCGHENGPTPSKSIGGVDVGNPGVTSLYQAEYTSTYGYRLRYPTSISLIETKPNQVVLHAPGDSKATMTITAAEAQGVKRREADLLDLIQSADELSKFERRSGKPDEIIYSKVTSEHKTKKELRYHLTPQGRILTVNIEGTEDDAFTNEMDRILQSRSFDLDPPKIESVVLVQATAVENSSIPITIVAQGLLLNESVSATLVMRKLGSDSSSPIRLRPPVYRHSPKSFQMIVDSKDLDGPGTYIINRIGFFDQSGNADYFWLVGAGFATSPQACYSALPIPANQGFDDIADRIWKPTTTKAIAFEIITPRGS